jgi:hypothetical protein
MNKKFRSHSTRRLARRDNPVSRDKWEMSMLNKITVRRAAMAGLAALTLGAAVVGSIEPASAYWVHPGWGGGWGGYHHGWGYFHRGWYGGGWGYGGGGWGGVCPPGTHLGYWGHRCWPNY